MTQSTARNLKLHNHPLGPVRGEVAKRLAGALRRFELRSDADTVIRQVSGCRHQYIAQTSDGYSWSGYEFEVPGGTVVVLLPMPMTWKTIGMNGAVNKLPCAFGRGMASEYDAQAALARVARALLDAPIGVGR